MRIILGVLSLIWKLYIGFIFVVTALLFYPVITPFLFSEKNKKTAFKLFVCWSWTFRVLCIYFVAKKSTIKLPEEPCIIVANHSSYLDIFLMYSIIPHHPFLFLGKSEILKYPLIKTYFKKLNIPVHRGSAIKAGKSLIKAAKELKKGWSLVIFPEGGIPDEENPKLADFKDGAFQLAKNLSVPIVPMTFVNHYKLFSDPTNLLGPAKPGISMVYMHEPIEKDTVMRLSMKELKKLCFEKINEPLLKHHPHLHEE